MWSYKLTRRTDPPASLSFCLFHFSIQFGFLCFIFSLFLGPRLSGRIPNSRSSVFKRWNEPFSTKEEASRRRAVVFQWHGGNANNPITPPAPESYWSMNKFPNVLRTILFNLFRSIYMRKGMGATWAWEWLPGCYASTPFGIIKERRWNKIPRRKDREWDRCIVH